MKAPAFTYIQPTTVDATIGCLEQYGTDATVLAGGQSLMASLNMRLSSPGVLVDINDIEALSGITLHGDQLRIGAMTRQAEVERSPLVAKHAPLITMAMPHVAHPAIRNRGTIGGSIAYADPAAELPACIVALNAQVIVMGAGGERRIFARDFFQGLYDTSLADGELLVAIEIPIAAENQRFAFRELARRHGDYAIVGLCAYSKWSEEDLIDLRLVYFNVGSEPVCAEQTASGIQESWNGGHDETFVERLGDELDPPDDLNADRTMRLHLAKVLTRRVLQEWAS